MALICSMGSSLGLAGRVNNVDLDLMGFCNNESAMHVWIGKKDDLGCIVVGKGKELAGVGGLRWMVIIPLVDTK